MRKKIYILGIVFLLLTSCQSKLVEEEVLKFSETEELIYFDFDTMNEALPQSKDDGKLNVNVSIINGDEEFTGYGVISVQGTSTSKWPKKNWSIKLYKDKDRTKELKISFGNSIGSNKWILKAEWIDPSMMRNVLAYNLWGDIVNNRENESNIEVQNSNRDQLNEFAQGYPFTYPSVLTVNGEHYGTSILMLGHDEENFNIDKSNPTHIYMTFDARGGYTPVKTWVKFDASGVGTWIEGYYPEVENMTEEHYRSIGELGIFIRSPQNEFEDNFDKFLDKNNIIDMLLFIEVTYDNDAIAQDIEMVTYDLQKWYWLPWDKDTTFGLRWDGTGINPDSLTKLVIDYEEQNTEEIPWYKTYHAFQSEIEERYRYLRDNDIFTVNNIENLSKIVSSNISEDLYIADYERWKNEGRPVVDEISIENILEWFEIRLETLDAHFNYKSEN